MNVSLRYLGPWDPWTLGPLDLGGIAIIATSSRSRSLRDLKWTFLRVKLDLEITISTCGPLGPCGKFYDGGWWHCNYSYKLQVQVSVSLEIDIAIEIFRVHLKMTWTQA